MLIINAILSFWVVSEILKTGSKFGIVEKNISRNISHGENRNVNYEIPILLKAMPGPKPFLVVSIQFFENLTKYLFVD